MAGVRLAGVAEHTIGSVAVFGHCARTASSAAASRVVVHRSCLRCGPPGPVLPIVGLALVRVVRNVYTRRERPR